MPQTTLSSTNPQVLSAAFGTSRAVSSDWRSQLPVLIGGMVTLRELHPSDARSLFDMLANDEVARYISPPPTTVEGFEKFIAWTQQQRQRGKFVSFGVVPDGMTAAVGLFQVRKLETGSATAEWGFALGSSFWGTGAFLDGGKLTVDFTIETLGVHRLEARAAMANARGNGALRKIGAVREGVMRQSFGRNGEYLDQALWSILDVDWIQARRQPARWLSFMKRVASAATEACSGAASA